MDSSISKLVPLPVPRHEIAGRPRDDRSRERGRFSLEDRGRDRSMPTDAKPELSADDLAVSAPGMDESGSKLDLMA